MQFQIPVDSNFSLKINTFAGTRVIGVAEVHFLKGNK